MLRSARAEGYHPADFAHQHDVFDRDRKGPIDRFDLRHIADAGRRIVRPDRLPADPTTPATLGVIPRMVLSSVVFPAPLGPTMPTN